MAENILVEVIAQADPIVMEVQDSIGNAGFSIPLSITANLTDLDGSESLTIVIRDLPEDAVLSAGQRQSDGTWLLVHDDLADLHVTPSRSTDQDLVLSVTAISRDGESEFELNTTLKVEVVEVVNEPPEGHQESTTTSSIQESQEWDRSPEEMVDDLSELLDQLDSIAEKQIDEATEPKPELQELASFVGATVDESVDWRLFEREEAVLFELDPASNEDQPYFRDADQTAAASVETDQGDQSIDTARYEASASSNQNQSRMFAVFWGLFKGLGGTRRGNDSQQTQSACQSKPMSPFSRRTP